VGPIVPRPRRRVKPGESLEAPYAELDTGHYPMLSEPAELVRLLG
jgi:hypothetical protein